MKRMNIFCIVGKTGGGKDLYLRSIIKDKRFMKKEDLSLLVYGTTRNMRPGEEDGVTYHFHTDEEYTKIAPDELIESRSYYTLNDGEVYYFTKNEYFENAGTENIICSASPYQYESYRYWCARENLKKEKEYNLYIILLASDLKTRMYRLLERATKDSDIYELCRRVQQEKMEFEDVGNRIPEIIDPMLSSNSCLINNNGSTEKDIEANVTKIKEFIQRYSK